MSRSLQRHLSKMLALLVLASGVLASTAAFYFAYNDAQEFQDDTLRQIAALGVGTRSTSRQLDAASSAIEDPESRVQLFHLPEEPHPAWLPATLEPGFHTLSMPGGDMRVFVRDGVEGNRIVVVQSTESRNEIAFNSALRTLVPLLVLVPILIMLIAIIVRSELKSLRRLSEDLDRQAAARPEVLPEHNLPDEIIPFVQAINRLLERVDRMIAEQRRFIADAAHELRTPLTALSLQAQNLAQANSREQMQERLVTLQAGIERARTLTVRLLDLARLQAGEVKQLNVDVHALALELMAEFHPLAQTKGIDFGLEEHGLRTLVADSSSLRLILRNALENAIKYTPDCGEVTLRLVQENDESRIEVADNGPGMANDDMAHAFEPFRRFSDSGQGSGLGLAIAHEAAIRTGGTVSLAKREDMSGLVFRYTQTGKSGSSTSLDAGFSA